MIDPEAVKAAVSCRQLLEDNGITVNRQGFAVCPFHGDRDASLKVYRGDRGWCCFGCHKGGDVINLARELYGVTFPEALRMLNQDYALGLSEESTAQERKKAASMAAFRKSLMEAKQRKVDAAMDNYFRALDRWIEADRHVKACTDTEITDSLAALLREREDAMIDLNDAHERRDRAWEETRH